MAYNKNNNCNSECNFNIKTIGLCDVSKLSIDGSKRLNLNWTEVSIPELLTIPSQKPDIEDVNRVYVKVLLNSINLIETPFASKIYDLYPSTNLLADIDTAVTPAIAAIPGAIDAIIGTNNTALLGIIAKINEAIADPNTNPDNTLGIAVDKSFTDLKTITNAYTPNKNSLVTSMNTLKTMATTPTTTLQAVNNAVSTTSNLVVDALTIIANTPTAYNDVLQVFKDLEPTIAALTPVIAELEALYKPINDTLFDAAKTPLAALGVDLENLDISDLTKAFEVIPNAEGTCLSGRKLIVEGTLSQKIVYTANVDSQSVHSAIFEFPFTAFIIPYASFEGLSYEEGIVVSAAGVVPEVKINGFRYKPSTTINVDLCEEFSVDICIEDIFVNALNLRQIFKSVTLFLYAKPINNI